MDANDYYKRGNASAAAKNYDPAIADYTEAIRRVPDTPKVAPVYNARGIAYYNKGDFAKALGDFSEVLRLTPDNARAYENRGKVYQHEKDFPAAIGDFKKSLELASNNPILRENLEKLLALTGGDNPSPETGDSPADPEVSVSAESGNSALPKQFSTTEPQDPQTQFELGLGCHNVKNNEKAVYWYTKAAKQGHASAQYNLGFCYTRGEGVRKNDETAVQWFAKAAEQGLAQGQYVLGFSYHKGIGIPQDTEKAVYWYEKAAKQGDSRAQEELQKLKNRVPQNRPSPETEKPSPPSSPSPQNGNLAVDSNNASPLPKNFPKTEPQNASTQRVPAGKDSIADEIFTGTKNHQASTFDGGLLELVGITIISYLIISVTLGIATPWAMCMLYRWYTDHTLIEGRRLHFSGTGLSLFGSWIKWWLLTIITLGIYGWWIPSKLEKWKVKNTSFADPDQVQRNPLEILEDSFADEIPVSTREKQESQFDGGLLERVGATILGFLVTVFTLGIATPWAMCMLYRWSINHTLIEGRRLHFSGTGGDLFRNWIKWWLLSVITLGIYGWWTSIKLEKWKVKNTSFADPDQVQRSQPETPQRKPDEWKKPPSEKTEEEKQQLQTKTLKIAKIAGLCAAGLIFAVAVVSIARSVINHAVDSVITKTLDAGKDVVNHAIDTVVEKSSSIGVSGSSQIIKDIIPVGNQSTSTDINSFTAVSPPAAPAFAPTHTVATNDRTNLRLRSSPSTASEQIMSLPYGSSVQVLQIGDSFVDSDGNAGNWTYVATPEGGQGWCFGAYLKSLGN